MIWLGLLFFGVGVGAAQLFRVGIILPLSMLSGAMALVGDGGLADTDLSPYWRAVFAVVSLQMGYLAGLFLTAIRESLSARSGARGTRH